MTFCGLVCDKEEPVSLSSLAWPLTLLGCVRKQWTLLIGVKASCVLEGGKFPATY